MLKADELAVVGERQGICAYMCSGRVVRVHTNDLTSLGVGKSTQMEKQLNDEMILTWISKCMEWYENCVSHNLSKSSKTYSWFYVFPSFAEKFAFLYFIICTSRLLENKLLCTHNCVRSEKNKPRFIKLHEYIKSRFNGRCVDTIVFVHQTHLALIYTYNY